MSFIEMNRYKAGLVECKAHVVQQRHVYWRLESTPYSGEISTWTSEGFLENNLSL
jgi:hypothetical protein